MRKSLIITVVITLLCLCGCEAVVTVPESPEPTKASEMLLTTTAAEESTDKLEATTTSSVEIDVPGKNEEEPGTPTGDVVSVDNEAGPSENNDPVSPESTAPSFEEEKADKPSEQTEAQLPAPSEPPRETEQSKPTEQPVATERDDAPAEVPAPTEPPATTEPPIPAETELPVETQPKTAYDYEFDINAIRADCIAIGQGKEHRYSPDCRFKELDENSMVEMFKQSFLESENNRQNNRSKRLLSLRKRISKCFSATAHNALCRP